MTNSRYIWDFWHVETSADLWFTDPYHHRFDLIQCDDVTRTSSLIKIFLNKPCDLTIFCDCRNNVLIIRPYLYQSCNVIRYMILFLPPLKLNLSVYSGSFAYLASGPFFWRDFATL
jgi:hypothetical protein